MPHKQQHFYPRTINLTNIKFTKEEVALLNHGTQYNMQKPLKSYWTNLVMEKKKSLNYWTAESKTPFVSWPPKN